MHASLLAAHAKRVNSAAVMRASFDLGPFQTPCYAGNSLIGLAGFVNKSNAVTLLRAHIRKFKRIFNVWIKVTCPLQHDSLVVHPEPLARHALSVEHKPPSPTHDLSSRAPETVNSSSVMIATHGKALDVIERMVCE